METSIAFNLIVTLGFLASITVLVMGYVVEAKIAKARSRRLSTVREPRGIPFSK